MNKFLTAGLVFTTTILSSAQAKAGTLLIDDFNTEFQNVNVTVPSDGMPTFPIIGKDTNEDFSANIVGGYRDITVSVTASVLSGSSASAKVAPKIGVSNGLFSISNEDGVKSDTTIIWDGNDEFIEVEESLEVADRELAFAPVTSSFPLNFLESGIDTNAFALDVESIDLDAEVKFIVKGNNNEEATLSQSNLAVGNATFDYEDFMATNGDYASIFSDVKSISLEVTGPVAFDASFDTLRAVNTSIPEPTSILSLLGIVGFSIRRQKMSVK